MRFGGCGPSYVDGEDPTEYDRQRKYIENHPDCESVPPKQR